MFLLLILATIEMSCQELKPSERQNKHSMKISLGFNGQRFRDINQSSIFRTAKGVSIGLLYSKLKEANESIIAINVNQARTHLNFASSAHIFSGNVIYENLFKLRKNVWIGPFIDAGSFITIRGGVWIDPGASITYGVWSSIGMSLKKAILLKNNWVFTCHLNVPLIAYTIRPVYGYPYPSEFLKEGVYGFDESGMGKIVLSSGKFQTINNFMNVQLRGNISKIIGKRNHQIGLEYHGGYLFFNGVNPMANWQNSIFLNVKLNFGKK